MPGWEGTRSGTRVGRVPVEPTRYEVPGWGTGELWMRSAVVLAHELRFASPPSSPGPPIPQGPPIPPKGAHGPPTGTLAGIPSRRVNGLVSSPSWRGPADRDVSARDLVERFRAFLGGEPVPFDDVELDLSWATAFHCALHVALRGIPRGEVVTYGELAALAGRPGAARAAGTFCATNRFALIVPCHRVVAADGIGGYGQDGVPIKRRLLALEGVRL